ncbi:hypothetical protein PG991_002825 [Apiospora marii]|uniref:Uncharacterized protein n=1 Tax=Apiospora marii TaxID=335849 RepID=A0ABR1SGX7_9PEZI
MQFSTIFVSALAAVACPPSQMVGREDKQQNQVQNQDQAKAQEQAQQDQAKAEEQAKAQEQNKDANKDAAAQFDLAQLNNGAFNNLDIAYLNVLNKVDLNALAALAVQQNLNLAAFQNIFNAQAFDLNAILQLQQLVQLQQLQQLGLLGGVDLAALQLNALNLGLIGNVGAVNLQQFVNADIRNQVQAVVSGANVIVISQ